MSKKIRATFLLTLAIEAGNSTSHAFRPTHVPSSTFQAFRSANYARSFPCRMSMEGNMQYARNETAFRDVVMPPTFSTTSNVDFDVSRPTNSRYNNMMMTPYSIVGGKTLNVSPAQTDMSAFTPTSRNEPSPRQSAATSSWKDRLIDISNIASFLCVLDCTLLPLISIALPALSWISSAMPVGATSNNEFLTAMSSLIANHLPSLGHGIALFFVIPIGLLTTFVNFFFGHKQLKYTAAALFGLLLIYTTNSNSGIGIASIDSFLSSWGVIASHPPHLHEGSTVAHVHDACGAIVGAATGMLAHTCGVGGEGWMHRLTNTVGCVFLLGSNYYGRKYMEKRSKGCAASVLAEVWGDGNDRVGGVRRPVCLPGCGCEVPSYGKSARIDGQEQVGEEMFFSWDKAAAKKPELAGSDFSGTSRFKRFRK